MTLRVATLTGTDGEIAALAAWTGETEEQVRADLALHEGPREHWLAWQGGEVVGVMQPWLRPDGHLTLYFGPCRPGAYAQLAATVTGACQTMLDATDTAAVAELEVAGFTAHRREHEYELPVRAFDAPVPAGLRIVTADRTTLPELMALDCALRDDVPGARGWQPDPQWFREETYDSPFFDPKTYLVALDGARYVGLARVWLGPRPLPRLGMVGVLPGYRRRGLALAMIALAFTELAGRGMPVVTAEADVTNAESNALLTRLGGRVVGGSVELRRP